MLIYQFVTPDAPISVPAHLGRYKCLLLIERSVAETLRNEVGLMLVDTGCAYAMAWGLDCSLWEDSIDWANIEQFKDCRIPDDRFVITTSHDTETIQDVLWFAKVCAAVSYTNEPLDDLLVLDFSLENRAESIQAAYDRAD